MRAMAVTDYTAPLQLVDLPEPKVQPGLVLIRILACGVCYSDLKTARGHMPYSPTLRLPHVPGHEICGEVVEAGPDTGFQAGDRVVVYNYWSCGCCAYCRMGRENLCQALQGWVGFTTPGGFEEFLAVPADRLLPLPDGITSEQAATVSCATGTGYRAVVTRGRVQPGETVVVLGVGGVGLHALQVARAAGARPLAVDIDRRKLEAAERLGAAGVALAGEEATTLVRDHTAGLGADVVVDTVGHEETLRQAAELTRRGGRVIGVGYIVGGFSRIPTDEFVLREIEFLGSRYVQRHELERVLRLVAAGQVQPVVDDVLPLEAANEALERLERGQVVGRIVLSIGS
ncbi:MAG: alcohol dehydrogenase catalytic domain-containing protein [Anaerolineae bacterium]